MIDRQALLKDATRLLRVLEEDLIARSDSMPEVRDALRADYEEAQKARRTAQNYEDWRTDYATQQAVAWVLSAVFVRFLEDNALIAPPQLAGPGELLQRARDEHELYFRAHPTETDREYLLHVFHTVGKLPGAREVFGKHNPVFELPQWLSGDAAGALLQFFQRIDADTGALVHDFADPDWNTRFLGDLYQDLSEATRKKYALLQTPEFIEEFILDRTLDPALDEFGLNPSPARDTNGDDITGPGFRMIDPACGSGHFLLGAFARILDRWQRKEPGTPIRDLVQRTLDSVCGVDLNPYAIAIARFRLLLVALRASGVNTLKDAPAFHFNLAAGDSLLHGIPSGEQMLMGFDPLAHHFFGEDIDLLRKLLRPGAYHAVVANPPYIVPKDALLGAAYRDRYTACHRKYSLSVPFMERIYQLAIANGFTGQITSNSFMKREFGKKIIEDFFPTIDLTHVVDTSGAYIPGHGTPTVILFGRHRTPLASTLRTVLGIRGEPSTPTNPAFGRVWQAIESQIDLPGSISDFISAGDSARLLFHKHPWSIGGGGASELKEELEAQSEQSLIGVIAEIGVLGISAADDVMLASREDFSRQSVEPSSIRRLIVGDELRDWIALGNECVLFPYASERLIDINFTIGHYRWLWPTRTHLWARATFGKNTYRDDGRTWWEWHQTTLHRLRVPLSIIYSEVATHNHFILDRGGNVFNRTAPVIKLPADKTEDEHLALQGLLNSSTSCFWMKQVCHCKGSTVDQHGARQTTVPFEDFYAFNGTQLKTFPLPVGRPLEATRLLDQLAQSLQSQSFPNALTRWATEGYADLRFHLKSAQEAAYDIRLRMVALQEELDWQCYRLYGLAEGDALEWPEAALDALPPVHLGERAFEIVLARKLAAGEEDTTWFARHGSTPITELPTHWPEAYRALVQRRIDCIERNANIALIERPEYKRRWNWEGFEEQFNRALRTWLLDRLESYFDFDGRMNDAGTPTGKVPVGTVCSVAQLTDIAREDAPFMELGEVYANDLAFDVQRLVSSLVEAESVPLLPVLRYKESGLRKRAEWEKTWVLQRQEDAIDALGLPPHEAEKRKKAEVGNIPVPPKYTSADFLAGPAWRLRGKLDVPKERWISLPHCEGADGTLMLLWAGNNHLQQAQALSAHFVDIQERLGGRDDARLLPLLAGLLELLPWLKQWHNAIDPVYNMPMGDFFESFVQDEARNLEKTLDEIRAWTPPITARGRGRKAKAKE
jgi:hypothetical protein